MATFALAGASFADSCGCAKGVRWSASDDPSSGTTPRPSWYVGVDAQGLSVFSLGSVVKVKFGTAGDIYSVNGAQQTAGYSRPFRCLVTNAGRCLN